MPSPTHSRPSRLLGLALAKGWVAEAHLQVPSPERLVEQGLLSPSQLEALGRELDRGVVLLAEESVPEEAPTAWRSEQPGDSPSQPTASGVMFSTSWIKSWAHFEDLVLLAEGGMGRIFKARDTRLRRMVALKLLRREDPELERRLLQEAELQARVNHPNVCAIYEVGFWSLQAYIAMELVEGDTFQTLARGWSMEDKLALMVQVCEGVHAAHRRGLIHRDLKPVNLMAVREDRGWRAVVMDFGLARPLQGGQGTEFGTVLGTVHYMSPEQARGQDQEVDRRTDLYALGATLYELFAARPPFHDSAGLDALHRVLVEPPQPLSSLAEVPRDLDTVVMKCLEKDPASRYDTARALGEDLQRILDGEPILARPVPLRERVLRWARKNRLVVAVGSAGVASALVLGAWGLRERLLAGRRAAYAQRFGQEAERIEGLARYGRVAPVHDLAREREAVWSRLRALESEVDRAADLAKGPGHYALGRSWLALGDPERAREALELAWREGFQSPEAAAAQGRALAQLYIRRRAELSHLTEPQARQAALGELERTLRDPAREFLRAGRSDALEPAAYAEGLLALVEGRPVQAREKAAEALRQAPWFYEARRLEAEAWWALAQQEPGAAGEALVSLGQARAMAPSDPELVELESRLRVEQVATAPPAQRQALLMELEALGKTWLQLGEGRGRAWLRMGQGYGAAVGPGAEEELRRAWMRRAFELQAWAQAELPHHADPSQLLAVLLAQQARAEHSGDPGDLLVRAMAAARRAHGLDPSSAEINFRLLMLYVRLLEHQHRSGQPDRATFEEALALSQELARRYPEVALYSGAMGGLLVERANNAASVGEDPGPYLDRAQPLLEEALRREPAKARWRYGRANARLVRAESLARAGRGAEAELAGAEEDYRRALELNPADPNPQLGLAMVAELQARTAADPRESAAWAKAALARYRASVPRDWQADLLGIRLALLEPRPNRRRLEAALEALARLQPRHPDLAAVRNAIRAKAPDRSSAW